MFFYILCKGARTRRVARRDGDSRRSTLLAPEIKKIKITNLQNFIVLYAILYYCIHANEKGINMSEINTDTVYKQLKKQNGEAVAKVIREAVLLDIPNIVHILEFAGNNPEDIKQLVPVIREVYKTQTESEYHTDKNPLELLSMAGYDAFVVKNVKQKDSIKQYYRPGEELCTFRDPTRHENYYMIHAIKHSADQIKPSKNPQREDEYGTSVISIQIAKTGGFISIKNRYNHTVDNPDATFNNNPDNIIPGLSESLKKYFNVDFNTAKTPMPDNYRMVHDQLVRYNFEINNAYLSSDYYFSGSTITKLNKDYEIMLDIFVLDTRNGELTSPGKTTSIDAGYNVLHTLFKGKKIKIENNPENKKEKVIFVDGIKKMVVSDGQITELYLPEIKTVWNNFLRYNRNLKSIELPNVTEIDEGFLSHNKNLKSIELPNVKTIGDEFLSHNKNLESIELPNVTKIGDDFLSDNVNLKSIKLPNVKTIGDEFLLGNGNLESIELPNVTEIGFDFLWGNENLKSIELPNVTKIGDSFLSANVNLKSIKLPNVKTIGDEFLSGNENLESIELPNVTKIGGRFLSDNENLKSIKLPNVKTIGDYFLSDNKNLKSIKLPNVKTIGDDFLSHNKNLKSIELPNVTKIGDYFLSDNEKLKSIKLPNVKTIGGCFLSDNENLESIELPNISPDNADKKRLQMICAKKSLRTIMSDLSTKKASHKFLNRTYHD